MRDVTKAMGLGAALLQRKRLLPFIACALLGLGVWLPILRTTSGYTYSIYGTGAWLCYLAVAAVLLAHAFLDQMSPAVALKVLWLITLAFIGVLLHALYIAHEGMNWFYYQTAFDMPGWDSVNQDSYWTLINSMLGMDPHDTALRDFYNSPYRPLFSNTINNLPLDDVQKLCAVPGGGVVPYPVGLVSIIAALSLQIRCMMARIGELKSRLNPA